MQNRELQQAQDHQDSYIESNDGLFVEPSGDSSFHLLQKVIFIGTSQLTAVTQVLYIFSHFSCDVTS